MKLTSQRRLAAQVMKVSPKRVWFDQEGLTEVKEAITKIDVKNLINKGLIGMKPMTGISKARARKRADQKRKGRRKGPGTRKGKVGARLHAKDRWIDSIRIQRKFLKDLKKKNMITREAFRELYSKSKGNFFRSVRHIKLYLEDHNLVKKQ